MGLEREGNMRRSGYVATFLGAACGAVLLAFGIGATAAYLEVRANPDDGWAGLAGMAIGGTVGAVAGAGLGTWAALRWRGHERAGITAIVMAVAAPAWAAASFAVSAALCRSLDCLGPFDSQGTLLVVAIGGLVGVAALCRWIVLRVASRDGVWDRP